MSNPHIIGVHPGPILLHHEGPVRPPSPSAAADRPVSATARLGVHTREHRSVLAAVEKRTLVWIAERLPRWINSDHLTALGAAAMAGTGGAFAAASVAPWTLLLVPVTLAFNWFGDSLDGTVARVRNQQRPRYGYYLDHVVDMANATMMFAGLALSGVANPWTRSEEHTSELQSRLHLVCRLLLEKKKKKTNKKTEYNSKL